MLRCPNSYRTRVLKIGFPSVSANRPTVEAGDLAKTIAFATRHGDGRERDCVAIAIVGAAAAAAPNDKRTRAPGFML
jgi:hypothetical protein